MAIRLKFNPLETKEKANKYNAKVTVLDGLKFHSDAEAQYYAELKLKERAHKIRDIVLQPAFVIMIDTIKICKVILDFKFFDIEASKVRYVDVKGVDNSTSKLKRKLVQAQYKIKIDVVKKKRS